MAVVVTQNPQNISRKIIIGENSGPDGIIDVVIDIGNLVTAANYLTLQRFRNPVTGMTQNAHPNLISQIQALTVPLQNVHNTQTLLVVAKGSTHAAGQRILSGMAEGGVTQIVTHGNGLCQIFVQTQRLRNGTGNASDLQRMGQSGTIMIALRGQKNLDEGNVAVLTAENTAQRPFIEGVNAYIESYTIDTTLNFVEELGDDYRENFFIGYKGKLLADNEAPHTLFNIYRIDGNNKATLISSKTESLALTDADWSTLPLGDYTYAAEAVYDNKKTSSRTLSDAVTLTGIESITAQGEVKAIEIYATNGVKLLATDDAASISLPAGIYIARYLIGDKWTTRKLIIAQ